MSTFQILDAAITELLTCYAGWFGDADTSSNEPWPGYNLAEAQLCAKHGWTLDEHTKAFVTGSHQ